jgi:sarcosine oxidase subunit alpha
MHARQGTIANVPALLMRIGFTGELSYEIHVPAAYALHVWQSLMEAGQEFGMSPFGVEAQRILRLEKGHIIVGQDTDALTNPLEADMGWVVKLDKEDFLGKHSLSRINQRGLRNKLVGFTMPDGTLPEEANQIVRQNANTPIGLEIIGRITSVRYSPTLDKIVGLCWLPIDMAEAGTEFQVRVKGQLKTGRVIETPFYDAEGTNLRS